MKNDLSFRDCFTFPIATPAGRRDIFVGGLLLLTLLFGWILNLGHRLEVVHRLANQDAPYFRGFAPWQLTFRLGLRAFTAITLYLMPSILFALLAMAAHDILQTILFIFALIFFLLAIFVLPGGMTHNAATRDMTLLYRPDKAWAIAKSGGRRYLKAWLIALTAVTLSLAGLLVFGIGFLFSSVWAWSVVGYAFSRALLDVSLMVTLPH
jgi:uncharacterized membrane protein